MSKEYEISSSNTSNDTTFQLNFSNSLTRPLRKKPKIATLQKDPVNEIRLLPVSVLPDSAQCIFPFENFNRMQTESFENIYRSNENCIVTSPTGSGKTVLFELAILNAMNRLDRPSSVKVLYIAPTKSLCNEKYQQWKSKFIMLSVGMLTSDTSFTELEKVKAANIIICTPEKWDVITRKWTDYPQFFAILSLVLVDEIHILQEHRGSTLEVILTRMNSMCQNLRIVAVSATIPNIHDIADWLKTGGPTGVPAKVLAFDDSYRQVVLRHHVYSFYNKFNNEFQMDALFNTRLVELINKHSKGKPVLIFCPTRQSTIVTARHIALHDHEMNNTSSKRSNIKLQDKQLSEIAQKGIAFHHAGLSMTDRSVIEDKFTNGDIKVLCSTSTLAVGVNLPAYLVIIKGTRMWSINGSQEYSTLDILQMIGRAGRPQFETEGTALILTDEGSQEKYENLLKGTSTLESCLHLNLAENIVAEIALNSITSIKSAMNWLKNTFFYRRYLKNPAHYSVIRSSILTSDAECQLTHFCERTLKDLLSYKIILDNNGNLCASGYGQAMTRHYILGDTVKNIIRSNTSLKSLEVLKILANASEFDSIRLKHNEKKLYREINANPLLRYPFTDKKKQLMSITSKEQKISLLIQYELSGLEYPSYKDAQKHHQTLVQDKMLVFRHAPRVLKCMIDCFIEKNDGDSLKSTLFLLRSVAGKGWEDTPMILRQLNTIGLVSLRKLVSHGVCTFADMEKLTEQQIEYYLSLRPGNGYKIKSDLQMIPLLSLEYSVEEKTVTQNAIHVSFKVEVQANFKSASWHGQQLCMLIMLKTDTGILIDFRRTFLSKLKTPKAFRITIQVDRNTNFIEFVYSCEQIGGSNREIRYYLSNGCYDDMPKYSNVLEQIDSNQTGSFQTSINYSDARETINNETDDDEELLNLLAEKNNSNANNERQEDCDRSLLDNGNMKCHHTCKDKSTCRHLCCREGIPRNTRRKASKQSMIKHTESVQQEEPSSSKDARNDLQKGLSSSKSMLPNLDECQQMEPEPVLENPINSLPKVSSAQQTQKITYIIPSSSPKQSSPFDTSLSDTQDADLLNFLGSDIELG